MDPNLYCLCIGVDAYFYGWCDANPDFGIWSEMAQLKSLCLVVSESVYSKAAYWPTGQILDLGKLHFSHINFFLTRRNWETDPFLCFKFSTWELRRFIDLKRSVNCNPMGNIQFCNYNLFLYAKAWRRVFQATKTTYKPAGNKGADFQVWEVANHWNATTKRFMKKLGSLPSRTDEISALQVSPKSNCLTKIWHKIPVFGANTSFELKHFRGFFVAQEFNKHCHIVLRQCRRWRDSLVKGRWRVGERPLAWEQEALFGIPTKTNHFKGIKSLAIFKSCDFSSRLHPNVLQHIVPGWKHPNKLNNSMWTSTGGGKRSSNEICQLWEYKFHGHWFINITAESEFWTNGLWTRAFYLR